MNTVVRIAVTRLCMLGDWVRGMDTARRVLRSEARVSTHLAGRVSEQAEADGECNDGYNQEDQRAALDPYKHPPRHAMPRRATVDVLSIDVERFTPFGTHYMACFHVSPSKLLTAEAMLNTREQNQNALTPLLRALSVVWKENCSVVAVTAEKKVATVVRFRRLEAACFWWKRMVGIPAQRS